MPLLGHLSHSAERETEEKEEEAEPSAWHRILGPYCLLWSSSTSQASPGPWRGDASRPQSSLRGVDFLPTATFPRGLCLLVAAPLLPVVTIPTVPSGAARLPRESRGGSCRQESHFRPDGPHTRVRKRTGWGARRPQGLRPGLRGGSRGGLGGQRPAQPHPTRGPPCAALARCPSSATSRGTYTRKAFLLLHGPHQVSSPRVVSERA